MCGTMWKGSKGGQGHLTSLGAMLLTRGSTQRWGGGGGARNREVRRNDDREGPQGIKKREEVTPLLSRTGRLVREVEESIPLTRTTQRVIGKQEA